MSKSGHPRRDVTAGDALGPVLARETADLRRHEARLHEDDDAVHAYRIETRRLRSILAGYEPLFDQEISRHLQADLRRAGAELGGVRDRQVLAERVDRLLGGEPDEVAAASAREQVGRVVAADGATAPVSEHLDSEDYDDFVRRLERFSDLPPWTAEASGPVDEVLRPLLRQEWKRFRVRAEQALEPGERVDERLHDARKAAKRARYVCEAAEPVYGRRARRMARAAERVQRVLGDHHDSVLTQQLLGQAATAAAALGEDTFVLGRLQAREAAVAEGLRADFVPLLVAADRKGLRRWLS